jgi:hypothetical protein
MLVTFPEILFLAPFSALALRVVLAVLLGLAAWAHAERPQALPRAWALLEAGATIALIGGAWTQPVALVVAVWLFASLFVRDMRIFPQSTVLLALVMALSLVVTGAGALAFDLPL